MDNVRKVEDTGIGNAECQRGKTGEAVDRLCVRLGGDGIVDVTSFVEAGYLVWNC
jgi:hypothetical protein